MNKHELIDALASNSGLSKTDSEAALNAFIDVVTKELVAKKEVKIAGFGNFKTSHRAAREGVNPATGEKIKIKASHAAKFKPSSTLKDKVNGKK